MRIDSSDTLLIKIGAICVGTTPVQLIIFVRHKMIVVVGVMVGMIHRLSAWLTTVQHALRLMARSVFSEMMAMS